LTIEGGGCRGAYSAAVVKAFTDHIPNEELQWDIITGVSAGALDTGSYATFSIGQETAMADHTLEIWKSVTGPLDIFKPWPIWPPVDVFFKRPSFVDTQPLRELLGKYVTGSIKRHVTVGTTNLDKGRFEVIDGSIGVDRFREAMMCSSAVPVAFPH
jgi:predicted acylesterase/phospholipase RssA